MLSLLRCVSAVNGAAALAGGGLNVHTFIHLLHEEEAVVSQGISKHGTGEVIYNALFYNVLTPIENFYLMFEDV